MNFKQLDMKWKLMVLSVLSIGLLSLFAFNGAEISANKQNPQDITNQNSEPKMPALTTMKINKDDYKDLWSRVDSFENKQLPKSAAEVVDDIFAQAKKDGNYPQQVKAMIFQLKFIKISEDVEDPKLMARLEKEIEAQEAPVKNVLHSMLAEAYWQYFQNNRWRFYNRTETVSFDNEDILTWSLEQIFEKIVSEHQLALQNKALLQKIKTEDFEDIIYLADRKKNGNLRPTLYDFLAHRALDFYRMDENSITKPVYAFEIDNENAFTTGTTFTTHNFIAKDTLSNKYAAILLFQELERLHANDDDPEALVAAQLSRLSFVKKEAILTDKNDRYEDALKSIYKKHSKNKSGALAAYYLANYYQTKGNDYDHFTDKKDNGKFIKLAYETCVDAAKDYPNSFGGKNCASLINNIERKNLTVSVEEAQLPGEPFRIQANYTNVDKVFFRLYKANYEPYLETERERTKDRVKWVQKQELVKDWTSDLPSSEDFLNHYTEVKADGLPKGFYVLLASPDKNFTGKKSIVTINSFFVTELVLITRTNAAKQQEFIVVNRKTGAPVSNVKIETFQREYSRTKRKSIWKALGNGSTDQEGKWQTTFGNNTYNIKAVLTAADDSFVSYPYFRRIYEGGSNQNTEIRLFTDRSIYRPGQKVYFKGILLENTNQQYQLKPGQKVQLQLMDVNYQEQWSQTFTTNEFGSFNGNLNLPEGGLTGVFRLVSPYGQTNISVEEYKRPRFEVKFDTIKGSYALDEEVSITGRAMSYAGAALDNAKVEYVVERTVQYPYWGWWYRSFYQPDAPMVISKGVINSKTDGTFDITFNALSDKSNNQKDRLPIYSFKVTVKVTDNTGETHESSTTVRVGKVALDVSMQVPEVVTTTKEDQSISITTQNLNGAFEAAKVEVRIIRLVEPDRLLRKSFWQRNDQFTMSREAYESAFPYDVYDNELNVNDWKDGKVVYSETITTTKDYKIALENMKNWQGGKYKVLLKTKDKNGTPIELDRYFDLLNPNDKKIGVNEFFSVKPLGGPYEPGDKAQFLLNTAYDGGLDVYYYVEHEGVLSPDGWKKIARGQTLIEIPIKEKHIGGLGAYFITVVENRVYQFNETIEVPYPSRELDIEFLTFRDKLLPNDKEEWKIKIKGPEGEKVVAELLTAMYDASLDAFKPHSWNFNLSAPYHRLKYSINAHSFQANRSQNWSEDWNQYVYGTSRDYDRLNWFGFQLGTGYYQMFDNMALEEVTVAGSRVRKSRAKSAAPANYSADAVDAVTIQEANQMNVPAATREAGFGEMDRDGDEFKGGSGASEEKENKKFKNVSARTNLNETAFFFPELQTDKEGNVLLSFEAPEALTEWKLQTFAHSKDLMYGLAAKTLKTQKDIMITPNAPRFFRENDEIVFTAKVNNISDKAQRGDAILQLFNAFTMEPIDAKFSNSQANRSFKLDAGQSEGFEWKLNIPEDVDVVTYKVLVKAGKQSDGEQNTVPVLKNRMLVTETMPLPVRSKETKTFTFEKLANQNSNTLQNHNLTLEFTSNPAWYAVQALPYLMDYPNECAEQIFSRVYANSLASHVANSQPKIKNVFEAWKNEDAGALVSNLEKNQELKSLLLDETPWVMEAKNETERKKRIGLLFDMHRMEKEYTKDLKKLIALQKSDGGFGWFSGMRSNRYITQHIVNGFGKLDALGVKAVKQDPEVWSMLQKAVDYLDREIRDDYKNLKRYTKDLDKQHIGNIQVHYLYARTFFKDLPVHSDSKKAYDYYSGQAEKYWTSFDLYQKGLIAMALHRQSKPDVPNQIIKSLREFALEDEELGTYYKYNRGYYWYQAPIETQSMMIEVFDEIANDKIMVDGLKVWLLKQKQTQDWKTTRATVEAIYALLKRGDNWLASEDHVTVSLGDMKIDPVKDFDQKPETATGYFKVNWTEDEITKDLAEVKVENPNDHIAWGAMYWQYFEQLDKITFAETPLSIKKELFKKIQTDRGEVIEPITKTESLSPGDMVTVRIELRVDRRMNYVHMKDMRASGFEPVNVLSQYKYQDGLGYYESTRDASTNFFFDTLNPGTYVFEYPLKVYHKGDFSNGITKIQCMYAPEFTSHSEGVRVVVD